MFQGGRQFATGMAAMTGNLNVAATASSAVAHLVRNMQFVHSIYVLLWIIGYSQFTLSPLFSLVRD